MELLPQGLRVMLPFEPPPWLGVLLSHRHIVLQQVAPQRLHMVTRSCSNQTHPQGSIWLDQNKEHSLDSEREVSQLDKYSSDRKSCTLLSHQPLLQDHALFS